MSSTGIGFIISVGIHGFIAWGLMALAEVHLPVLQSRAGGGAGGGGGVIDVRLASWTELTRAEQPQSESLVEHQALAQAPQDESPAEVSAPLETASVPALSVKLRKPPLHKQSSEPKPATKLVNSDIHREAASPRAELATEANQTAALGAGSGWGASGPGADSADDYFGDGIAGDGPRVLRSPKPPYPREARRAQFEGRVVFEILIDTSGRVQEARLAQSSGRKDCDEAARDTIVEDWRFSPAMLRGVAIPWRQRVAVAYRLR